MHLRKIYMCNTCRSHMIYRHTQHFPSKILVMISKERGESLFRFRIFACLHKNVNFHKNPRSMYHMKKMIGSRKKTVNSSYMHYSCLLTDSYERNFAICACSTLSRDTISSCGHLIINVESKMHVRLTIHYNRSNVSPSFVWHVLSVWRHGPWNFPTAP